MTMFGAESIPTGSRSRHRVGSPALFRPSSMQELCAVLAAHPDTVLVGGGLDVVNRMKEDSRPPSLTLLQGVADLARVACSEGGPLEIGAMVSHDTLAGHALVRQHLPELAAAWDQIANIRIRMQGTVGGNLCAGAPGYEAAVLLAALGAEAMVIGGDGVAAAQPVGSEHGEAFTLRPAGCVTSLRVDVARAGMRRRLLYHRGLRPALWLALGVDVDLQAGRVVSARVVLGGLHAGPLVRHPPMSGMLLAELPRCAVDIAQATLGALAPPTLPWHGRAGYRERVAPVLLARLIASVAA